MDKPEFIYPDWPAPKNVKAAVSTRVGGVSRPPYESLNLGDHVGDDPGAVEENRARVRRSLSLPAEPRWLKQVHGTNVVEASTAKPGVTADGAWTGNRGVVLAIMTADCLPVFLCDRSGGRIALLHAGWRGLAAGVLEAGVQRIGVPPAELIAYLGPGIGPQSYEVGADVLTAFTKEDPDAAAAFRAHGPGKWWVDMYALARRRLRRLGVSALFGGEHCTLREPQRFYSYRRDGVTGRMVSLLWLT